VYPGLVARTGRAKSSLRTLIESYRVAFWQAPGFFMRIF